MASDRPQRGAGYLARALSALAAAAMLHLLLSHVLLSWLVDAPRPALDGAERETANLVVVATALGMLAMLYLRTQYSSPDHVTRSIPAALRTLPPLTAFILVPLTFPPEALSSSATVVQSVAPVVTATWTSALLLAVLLKRLLHALAIRTRTNTLAGVLRTFEPPTVAGSFARVLSGACFASVVLVIGAVLARTDLSNGTFGDPHTIVAFVGLLVMIGIAAGAGASVGQSPGREVVSIARRLDTIGYNPRQSVEWPVVATSFDEVGELFVRLEELRLRLAREASVYQQALDRTRETDAAKAGFLSAVSHELRTPLNSVCGFAQLLLEQDRLGNAQAEDVRLIRAAGQQLLELINDILDISMIESGELRLSFSSVDVAEVVHETVQIHQPLVGSDVELRAEIGPELPAVVCDRRRIGQILTNLVSNAIKFTEHGEIVVRAAHDVNRDTVAIRVLDTGIGIPEDELESIFEEYRQTGPVKRRKKGTGLGLAIARSIAIHHGGSLRAESTAGEGSCFTLVLPVNPPGRPAVIDVTEEAARAVQRAKQRSDEPTEDVDPRATPADPSAIAEERGS